jgi:hypothetical protein
MREVNMLREQATLLRDIAAVSSTPDDVREKLLALAQHCEDLASAREKALEGRPMSEKAREFLHMAADCRVSAERSSTPSVREELLTLAEQFERLANHQLMAQITVPDPSDTSGKDEVKSGH